jgi:hypothetical protein
VTFGNGDVSKETEIKKEASSTNKKKNSSSISTPTFSSGNSDFGLHRIPERYKHLIDVPTSEM